MMKHFDLWDEFTKSGEISDYLKFKDKVDGQGNKDAGYGDSYQRL